MKDGQILNQEKERELNSSVREEDIRENMYKMKMEEWVEAKPYWTF